MTGTHRRSPGSFGWGAFADARHEIGTPAGLVDNWYN
jgi:hypothetical protein